MHRLEHEAVAAEGDDDLRFLHRQIAVAGGESFQPLLRLWGRGSDEGDAGQGGAAEHLIQPQLAARTVERLAYAHTSFRCSRTGISRRMRCVMVWSTRPVAQPMPSEARAMTRPQGSQISECP